VAERRMFTKKIIDSDAFLDMPLSTQALYFHLNMRADDDGFINNPKKIMRMIGASEDDLKVLCLKRFVIPFESGVMVIKHWKMHNYIQKDRYKPTVYTEELALLEVKENGSYTDCIQAVDNMDTQVSIGKVSKGKVRVVEVSGNGNEVSDNDNNENADDVDEVVDNKLEYMGGTLGKGVVLLTEEQIDALLEELGLDAFNHYVEKLASFIIDKKAKVSNHYATIRKWHKEDMKVNG
jgi:hypothetical protein